MYKILPLILFLLPLVLNGCSETPDERAADRPATDTPTPPAVTDLRQPQADQDDEPAVERITEPAPADPDAPPALEWDALIPDDYQPDKLFDEFNLDELSDDDPRAAEFMEKLKVLWDEAPVREDLDGRQIRLPGFVVPVEADEKETTGFLLVPYYGACVHVPPPPANQTVYVITEAGKGTSPELFDVIWVTGTMSVKRIENDVAEAGYTLYATGIAPYE